MSVSKHLEVAEAEDLLSAMLTLHVVWEWYRLGSPIRQAKVMARAAKHMVEDGRVTYPNNQRIIWSIYKSSTPVLTWNKYQDAIEGCCNGNS